MARRYKVVRRGKFRGYLILKGRPGGGNGDGNGDGEHGGEEGILPEIPNGGDGENGNGDWETPTPEVPVEELPDPPPGVFEVPTPSHPVVQLGAEMTHLRPGGVWPRPEGEIKGNFLVLAKVPSHGWRYMVIDPDGIDYAQVQPARK